jgi:hypothetical protein
MAVNPGPNRQGVPQERPTQSPPPFDAVQSRELQYQQHGEQRAGKKDGYRVQRNADLPPERDRVSG